MTNLHKIAINFEIKNQKNMNGIYYCYDDEGVVFRVKSLYLKIEQSKQIVKK